MFYNKIHTLWLKSPVILKYRKINIFFCLLQIYWRQHIFEKKIIYQYQLQEILIYKLLKIIKEIKPLAFFLTSQLLISKTKPTKAKIVSKKHCDMIN